MKYGVLCETGNVLLCNMLYDKVSSLHHCGRRRARYIILWYYCKWKEIWCYHISTPLTAPYYSIVCKVNIHLSQNTIFHMALIDWIKFLIIWQWESWRQYLVWYERERVGEWKQLSYSLSRYIRVERRSRYTKIEATSILYKAVYASNFCTLRSTNQCVCPIVQSYCPSSWLSRRGDQNLPWFLKFQHNSLDLNSHMCNNWHHAIA